MGKSSQKKKVRSPKSKGSKTRHNSVVDSAGDRMQAPDAGGECSQKNFCDQDDSQGRAIPSEQAQSSPLVRPSLSQEETLPKNENPDSGSVCMPEESEGEANKIFFSDVTPVSQSNSTLMAEMQD